MTPSRNNPTRVDGDLGAPGLVRLFTRVPAMLVMHSDRAPRALWLLILACGCSATTNATEPDDAAPESPADVNVSETSADVRADASETAAEPCIGSCLGAQCGDDGCGNSCGTCAATEKCASDHKCHSTLPACGCFLGECADCYCGTALGDYVSTHSCSIDDLRGNEGNLWSCVGGKWSMGTTCKTGCYVAPPKTPDGCNVEGGRNLWIAYEGSTADCMGSTNAFYDCLLHHTNFNDFVGTWKQAPLGKVAGTAKVSCGVTDWQCIVDQGAFAPAANDVVLHLWSDVCNVGHNHWDASVKVAGKTVPIRGAEAPTGNVCSCQQALGMHEVFEASAQDSAADCCNGQTWHPLAPDCSSTLRDAGGPGWYTMSCAGTEYSFQTISPASNWTDISGCSKLKTL